MDSQQKPQVSWLNLPKKMRQIDIIIDMTRLYGLPHQLSLLLRVVECRVRWRLLYGEKKGSINFSRGNQGRGEEERGGGEGGGRGGGSLPNVPLVVISLVKVNVRGVKDRRRLRQSAAGQSHLHVLHASGTCEHELEVAVASVENTTMHPSTEREREK
jgi:hypothetical protein